MKQKTIIIICVLLIAAAIAVTIVTGKQAATTANIPEQTSDAVSGSESAVSTETIVSTDGGEENVSVDTSTLFEPVASDITVLTKSDAMIATFDGIQFYPGMTASTALRGSGWGSIRESDILRPGESGYMTLTNERWTNKDIQLNRVATARNGEVVLWVHNYSETSKCMGDCVVYKYKINYRGCKDVFAEQPSMQYLDKYTLGFNGSYPMCKTEMVKDNIGTYVRHFYGSIDDRQIILDSSSDEGLFALTVTYNHFYGPDFKGGDDNG